MQSRTLTYIHCSNSHTGGAEKSLLQGALSRQNEQVIFILPGFGSFSGELAEKGFKTLVLKWPPWITVFTQHQLWWQWPALLFIPFFSLGLFFYTRRLLVLTNGGGLLISSGIKSHCLCLLPAYFFKGRVEYNIRDFIEPRIFRQAISLFVRLLNIKVVANSEIVGQDYYRARVSYPQVCLGRPVVSARRNDGILTITHAAYFAPYKGQDLFLDFARQIVDAGIRAEFWLVGDVIYPASRYMRYKQLVNKKIGDLGLQSVVKVWGITGDVQGLLEQTHILLHCTRDPEPFGRVVMEALMCGCQALCRRGSGICEVVEEVQAPDELKQVKFPGSYVFVGLPGGA